MASIQSSVPLVVGQRERDAEDVDGRAAARRSPDRGALGGRAAERDGVVWTCQGEVRDSVEEPRACERRRSSRSRRAVAADTRPARDVATSADHRDHGPGRLLPGRAAARRGVRGRGPGPRSGGRDLPDLRRCAAMSLVRRRPARPADAAPRPSPRPGRDELYHLAAPTFVPDSWEDPTETVGRDRRRRPRRCWPPRWRSGPAPARVGLDLERGLRRRGRVARSTSARPMRPRTPYGVAKLAAHGLVGALREHHGLFACSGHHLQPRVAAPARALPAAQGHARRRRDRARARGGARARRPRRGARLVARAPTSCAARVAGAAAPTSRATTSIASGVGRTVARARRRRLRRASTLDWRATCASTRRSCAPPEPTPPVGDPTRARERAGLGAGESVRGDHRRDGRRRPGRAELAARRADAAPRRGPGVGRHWRPDAPRTTVDA